MAIADDLVGHAHIAYLGDPFEQYCGLNGKPLIGGWIEVYQAGTDTRYITMQNFDGAMNPFKIPLNADGRVVMLADPSLTYDMYVRNSYGDLVCSRLNVECTCPGNISIKGLDTYVRNTDGTLDVSLQTSSNNRRVFTVNTHNKELRVQEPLYFVENSNTATVIGFSGDNYATTADLADKMDISKLEYNNDGEISAYDGSAFAGQGGAGDPEVNDLVHSNSATWNDVSAKLDTTAFSTVSGNFLTAIPDDYATKDYVQSSVSSKLDSTAFSTVSGDFLTAHQDLSDYLTKVSADSLYYPLNSNPSGYLTAHQSLDGYLTKTSADTLYQPKGNYADATALDGKVDTSSFTAFSSTTNEKIEYISGALSGTYELSAGEGIDITDYPNEQKTVISVTAQGGNPEVEDLVTANSATWDSVTGKADTTALNDYATTSQLANKLDTTAFSTVSGNFLTAHQDLSNYATTASVAEKLDTTAFSDVSGSFLTAVPDTYLQNTDLTITDGKVTEISGVPLSAGDELPSGVMNTSALEYNAVNEISGYNGSAIAQYGAEKQWLVHDDTLVHAANSAQYALGVNLSAVAQLLGVDETVLFFAGNNSSGVQSGNLSESIMNFERIRVAGMDNDGHVDVKYIYPAWTKDADNFDKATNYEVFMYGANPYAPQNTVWEKWVRYSFSALTSFNVVLGYEGSYTANTVSNVTNNHKTSIRKVVGIGRKEV